MASIAQVPAAAEPPLIRQPAAASQAREALAQAGTRNRTTNGDRVIATVQGWVDNTTSSGQRWLWIRKKLYGPSIMNGARAALAAVLVVTLNPAAETQAAVVASEPETTNIVLEAEPAALQTEVAANLIAEGISVKPIVVATEIGRPERELREREAEERARQERARAAALARAKTAQQRTRATVATSQAATPTANVQRTTSSTGNSYAYGYCTWWVKAKRPDLPNQLGNANAWLSSARNTGLATGNAPQPGAAVVTSEGPIGHVAYVEAVDGDEIVISEMNFSGWNRTNTRRLKADSSAVRGYIY